ncbi:hypothetical protein JEFDOCMN_00078 [Enterococcus phage vB_OCPT_CCS1]|uniref:Uncharacterized protein n=2 Tax=Schiekvirus TaxID=2732968 RepID=A0A3B8DJP3_9CAUD|nr:hypothetical protein [Enterococcus faecium]YP_009814797.1 hypothetical protein HOU42_gp190 [Enterococcus phage EfV12-phi1]AYJ73453.1 hypothetical protein EFV12PHI1_46 [Enterococcus phage EfV12-phi1]UQT00636.1 hypothetical protein JEFDOCMN_00078 [Enterococcus phage vB_OCPT_CCS1]
MSFMTEHLATIANNIEKEAFEKEIKASKQKQAVIKRANRKFNYVEPCKIDFTPYKGNVRKFKSVRHRKSPIISKRLALNLVWFW